MRFIDHRNKDTLLFGNNKIFISTNARQTTAANDIPLKRIVIAGFVAVVCSLVAVQITF